MKACDEYEELMGDALAGELTADAESKLQDHLADCANCAAELNSLRKTLSAIPSESIDLPESLRPAIEQQIRVARAKSARVRVASTIAAAAALVIVAGIGYSTSKSDPIPQDTTIVANTAPTLPAAYTEYLANEEYPKAFIWLQNAIEESPENYDAPELHAALAQLAYEELHWYPEAYQAYKNYRASHPEAFRDAGEDVRRFTILDEAHAIDTNFASLHDWERTQSEGEVVEYAKYIERYPGTLFASDAVVHIAELVAEESGADVDFRSAAETALARLDNPVVVAQFKLELGHYYLHEGNDRNQARRLLEDVESSSVTALAMAAQKSLADLQEN